MEVRHLTWLAAAAVACRGADAAPTPAAVTDAAAVADAVADAAAGDLEAYLPPAGIGISYPVGPAVATGDFLYCDTPAQVVLVSPAAGWSGAWPGSVVTISRAGVVRVRGKTGAGRCRTDCGGPGGGYMGCSERGSCRVKTRFAGARVLTSQITIYSAYGSMMSVDGVTCEPRDPSPVAVCSTTRHRVAIADDGGVDPVTGRRSLTLTLHTGRKVRTARGSLGDVSADGVVWTYRFPDPAAGDVEVAYTVGRVPSAALRIAGKTEPCFVFALQQRSP